jgi:phosphatidylinositol phospholipase C delta
MVKFSYTLVSNISFRSVCETMRDVYDKEAAASTEVQGYQAAPMMLSLENHCNAQGQLRLVKIMMEVWSDRVLSEAVRKQGHDEEHSEGDHTKHVRLADLGSKIVVIVEHHIPESTPDEIYEGSSSEDDDEEIKQAKAAYKEKKKATPTAGIIPELADLGVYAQSVKPSDDSWFTAKLKNAPHHHLINVSESGLISHLPAASAKIAQHNAHHLMRVFPKGTRISSKNLNPVPFWGVGAQICALNWQTFGAGMQINEALFSGSDGYVLKPAALRAGGNGKLSTGKMKKLRLHIGGASDVPVPDGVEAETLKPYVSCLLVHPDDLAKAPTKRKTTPYKRHKLGFLRKGENPSSTDPIWNETLEWDYDDNELVFLRMLIKEDASFATNPILVVATVRLLYSVPEWRFIRMLDLKGRETKCSLLVKFEIADL